MTIVCDRFFDIETEAWDTFVVGGVVDADGTYFESWDEDEFFDNLLDTGGEVWGWNAGLYDMLWFLSVAQRRGVECLCNVAGTRITRLESRNTSSGGSRLRLRDAVALIPMSLEKASGLLSAEQRRSIFEGRRPKATGLPCVCLPHKPRCGGYCSIKTDMPRLFRARLSTYLKSDCLAGYEILSNVIDEAERCDYYLTGTVGGSSYRSAQAHLGLDKSWWDSGAQYKLAREGYYGGRCQVFAPTAESGFRYDIHSAYPAALSQVELPLGEPMELVDKAPRRYRQEWEGIYRARVHVPEDMHIPPLPWRSPNGSITFPVGTFEGSWTGLELRYAESLGVTVDIDYGLVWDDAGVIFAPFMEHVWRCRDRYAADDPEQKAWRTFHKWFANSCTGKLAESPDKEMVVLNPPIEKVKACTGGPRCEWECRCGSWKCIDPAGTVFVKPFWRLSDCAHVHWAAYLTAWARTQLHAQLIADGQGGRTAVYCDTDSVYATQARTWNIGDALGQWGSDGGMSDFVAVAKKAYRFVDDDGEEHVRCKGLQGITPEDFKRFREGGEVARDKGVMGLKSAARRGELFARKLISRSSHADGIHFGDRVLGPGNITYPQTVERIVQWQRRPRVEKP